MRSRQFAILLLAGAAALPGQPANPTANQQLAYTREHYTKYEFKIPMRDGVRLFVAVYSPKDTSQTYPILMQRTPYSVGPYGIDNYRAVLGPSEAAEKEGFIFAYADVRGRYLSEGTFVDVRPHKTKFDGARDFDDSTDTWDTVDWLVKHVANNNGRVGMWGISYPGHYAAHALIDSHPALKAVSPQAPMGDVGNGDDAYHNGAFYLSANFSFYTGFSPRKADPERPHAGAPFEPGTTDAYAFYLRMGPLASSKPLYFPAGNVYWDELLEHAAYDSFWQSRALAPYMKDVKPAVLWVGGWYDAEDLAGPLKLFHALEVNGASGPNTLVMGPWSHGGWSRGAGDRLGNLSFAVKTGEYFREKIELPFFVRYLKEKGKDAETATAAVPKAVVFETGANQWRRFDAWPPKNAAQRNLYLDAHGSLSWNAPAGEGFDEYVSDPDKPVPLSADIGGSIGMPGDYMTFDQRFASRRTDVLSYVTAPLEADVTVAGPITPALRVSTSGTDSDFVVKLIDVYPDDYPNPPDSPGVHMGGYQQLVRGEPFRGKYRASKSNPTPFIPGKEEPIEFWMPDVFHTFRTGHRIMVQVQSSWFPLIDRNPQKFLDIPSAKATDFQRATERVYRGGAAGSRIQLLVMQ
ncbi:MAG TPA: CocE/NonD family hydrolase [Bryobacteraceae bacterium]|nr:CocE/NonD family hydrolase [Bryobacteraceae bacterium]